MTYAEKYLKNNTKEEFISIINKQLDFYGGEFNIERFLECEVKPTLTEDERVILKNIDTQNFKAIGRKDDYLYLRYTDYTYEYGETDIKTLTFWYMYHDLFKFIQERRRIWYRRIIRR